MPCKAAPDKPNDAPISTASRVRGKRISSNTIDSNVELLLRMLFKLLIILIFNSPIINENAINTNRPIDKIAVKRVSLWLVIKRVCMGVLKGLR